ncbi:PTS cellobiose transporter subunit IIC [Helicovermis profundi]|uniref:Permease IIC component n=1 Tax=Helicovermis profundi TaxID=3065157 RepID=A0AAU9E5J5_9FIRM|nr:PTS sugar transporter subunit IIC [Clostridia bacterium S502]
MNGFISFLERKVVPVAAKFGSQRHLVAIRDGFVALMPLIIAGSFAVLLNNLPIPGYQNIMNNIFGGSWKSFGGNIWWGTFAVISLFLVFSISYNLAKSYEANGLSAGLISLANFAILLPQAANVTSPSGEAFSAWGNISWTYINAQGMFVAIIVALVSTEIFVKLSKSDKLTIKMPDTVPPAVSKSFASLIPGIIVLSIFALLTIFIGFASSGSNIFALISKFVSTPLQNVADSLGSAVTIVFMTQFLWFFGLHGSNIIGSVIEPILLPLLNANMEAVAAGLPPVHIVTKPFLDTFVYLGGAGTTLSLLIAIFISGKRKQNKEIAKLGIGPGLFNINEPVIFGMPIVLNPLLFIPFLFGPVVLVIISYFAMASGLVPKTIAMVPWTFPPIIGAALATSSIRGGILAAFNLVLAVLMYIPFIIAGEKLEEKRESKEKLKKAN